VVGILFHLIKEQSFLLCPLVIIISYTTGAPSGTMAEFEPFTFISKAKSEGTQLFDDFTSFSSGKTIDIDLQLVTALRARHPELIVT
jgi:hypothetical protein